MNLVRFAWVLLLAAGAVPASAETWQTLKGAQVEGSLSGVYGPLVVIEQQKATRFLDLADLDDAGIQRVATYLADPARASPVWSTSKSKVAKALKGRLQVLQGEKLINFDPGPRPEPKFYLVYFGAEWCPPCRAFSPRLVQVYQRLKRIAPDAFECIFISSDQDGGEQLKYVRKNAMPFPVLKFSQVGAVELLEKWKGRGIPSLIAFTREGEVVFHSYRGEEYLGPDSVLKSFEPLLQTLAAEGRPNRSLHRLAVAQYVRSAVGGNLPARPYLIDLDLRRYQTLEYKEITAMLSLDDKGAVLEVSVSPELPAVLEHQFITDANTWLFLPSVKAGQPQPGRVALPLQLTR
jgi:thiol-disulfide isomerase/thioredoxin